MVMLCGSMSKAAEHLYTSQPAISRLIQALEHETQFPLFIRSGAKITPTREALTFFREVQLYFNGIGYLEEVARRILAVQSESLRISTTPALAFGFLPRVIHLFKRTFPNVRVIYQVGRAETVMYRLMSGGCDVGFIPTAPGIKGVHSTLFYQLPGICAIPKGHPLEKQDEITVEMLADEPFITLTKDNTQRVQMDRLFDEAGITPNIAMEVQYGTNVCAFVGMGLGLSIVNPVTAHEYLSADIAFRSFHSKILFTSALVVPEHRHSRVLEHFVAVAQKEIKTYCELVPC